MEKLFLTILNMSLTGTVVILAVWGVRLLFRRLPRIYSYLLWSVVLIRLICPIAIETDYGIVPDARIGAGQVQMQAIYEEPKAVVDTGRTIPMETTEGTIAIYDPDKTVSGEMMQHRMSKQPASNQVASKHTVSASVWRIMSMIWFTGVVLFAGNAIVSYCRLQRKLRMLKKATVGKQSYDGCMVVDSEHIETPFTAGICKPVIYLPAGIKGTDREMVLEHERMHIRRKDYLIKAVAYFVTCIHWFNPFAWISFYFMEEDMETSCDEAVIRRVGYDRKKTYAQALLALSGGGAVTFGGYPPAFGENNVKKRIKNTLQLKKTKTWVMVGAAVLVLGAVAVLSVNGSKKTDVPTVDREEPNLSEAEKAELRYVSEEVAKQAAQDQVNEVSYNVPLPEGTYQIATPYTVSAQTPDGRLIEHRSIDFAAEEGTDIYAAADGVVQEIAYSSANGNYVILRHSNGTCTHYSHCKEILAEEGQTVAQGEVIARVGNTGMSTGPHLDFAVSYQGTYVEPVFEEAMDEAELQQIRQLEEIVATLQTE